MTPLHFISKNIKSLDIRGCPIFHSDPKFPNLPWQGITAGQTRELLLVKASNYYWSCPRITGGKTRELLLVKAVTSCWSQHRIAAGHDRELLVVNSENYFCPSR